MVRRLLASATGVLALGLTLASPSLAAKPNPQCVADCKAQRTSAITEAKSAFTTCKAAATDGPSKKACKRAKLQAIKAAKKGFVQSKKGCKGDTSGTCPDHTTTTTTLPPSCASRGGAPSEIVLTVPATGSDLDNGFSGSSHNFPVVNGSSIDLCLTGCDATTNPVCQSAGATGAGTANGETFGAPLPLLSSNVPVCVINEYRTSSITGTVNLQTGEMTSLIQLTSKTFVRPGKGNEVCPRCNGGSGLGSKGTCTSGVNQGKPCTVNGAVTVVGSTPADYLLSTDCPPEGNEAADLSIDLPLTTETAESKQGPLPCSDPPVNQTRDDACGTAECNLPCSDVHDAKGGINQYCCNNAQKTPCFPTKNPAGPTGGKIVRTGSRVTLADPWGGGTYPKNSTPGQNPSMVATFCIAKTGDASVDVNAGLPGPGAIILPSTVVVQAAQ